jgi:hypothetical protein
VLRHHTKLTLRLERRLAEGLPGSPEEELDELAGYEDEPDGQWYLDEIAAAHNNDPPMQAARTRQVQAQARNNGTARPFDHAANAAANAANAATPPTPPTPPT